MNEITSGNKVPASLMAMETSLKKTNKEVEELEKNYNEMISQIQEKKVSLDYAVALNDVDGATNLKNEIKTLDKDSVNVAISLENANDKSIKLSESISSIKLDPSLSMEARQLQAEIDNTEFKLKETKDEANGLKNELKESMRLKLSDLTGGFGGIKESVENVGKSVDKFKNRMTRLISTAFVFSVIRKSLNSLVSGFGNILKSNDQFSNSLNQIKANLMTAFAPIYEYILPALNGLMNTLAQVTGSIATFVAGLFGKTASQAKNNAKALSEQTKAQKKLNDEQGQVASFDKLEVAGGSKGEASDSGGSGIDFTNPITTDDGTLTFLNKIKEILTSIDTSNFQKSINNLWGSLQPFLSNVWDGFKWFLDSVILPLTQWTINDLLPAFFNILAGALDIVNQAISDLTPIFLWFWDNILKPIAKFTGGVIVGVLNGIGDALKWISQNDTAMTLLEGIAIAIALVAGALAIYNGAMILTNLVTGIFAGIMTVLTSPITAVIVVIGLLIGIIMLAIKHWDKIKETTVNVWNSIKSLISGLPDFFRNKFGIVGDIIANVFEIAFDFIKNKIDSVMRVFGGLKDFIVGIFTGDINRAIKGLGNVFGGVINGILSTLEAALNFLILPINALISGFNGTLGKIPGVPKLSNLKIAIPKIPKLATGAVIPANGEFLAVLGDQKHGRNLEAPESLIRQIVREESGNDDREIVLNASFDVRIGDEKVDRVVLKGIRLAERKLGKPLLVN